MNRGRTGYIACRTVRLDQRPKLWLPDPHAVLPEGYAKFYDETNFSVAGFFVCAGASVGYRAGDKTAPRRSDSSRRLTVRDPRRFAPGAQGTRLRGRSTNCPGYSRSQGRCVRRGQGSRFVGEGKCQLDLRADDNGDQQGEGGDQQSAHCIRHRQRPGYRRIGGQLRQARRPADRRSLSGARSYG